MSSGESRARDDLSASEWLFWFNKVLMEGFWIEIERVSLFMHVV